MVSSCCVKGCTEKFVRGGGVSYYRIASKPAMQRNAWIAALKRCGWIPKPHHRICSRHFVTGTWNSDPNHIDYIPTRCMSKIEDELVDIPANDGIPDMAVMDTSLTDIPSALDYDYADSNDNSSSRVFNTSLNSTAVSQQSLIHNTRVPIMGISSSQFRSATPKHNSPNSGKEKKVARKAFSQKWSSSPKLTSGHFCQHQDAHQICCRVIRELAEENQILKTQVSCLVYEIEKLRSESCKKEVIQVAPHTQVNGIRQALDDSIQDIEIASDSLPSYDSDDEQGLVIDDFPEEQKTV